jgi:hypothetical protein
MPKGRYRTCRPDHDYEPGRRFYFLDWDGIEFELVNYG